MKRRRGGGGMRNWERRESAVAFSLFLRPLSRTDTLNPSEILEGKLRDWGKERVDRMD